MQYFIFPHTKNVSNSSWWEFLSYTFSSLESSPYSPLFIWSITFADFLNILNQPCVSRTNPIWSWCMMLFDIFLGLIVYILLSTVLVEFQVLCLQKQGSLLRSEFHSGSPAFFPMMSHHSSALTQLLSYSGSWGESYCNLLFSILPKSCWVHPSPPIFPTSLELLITHLLFSR